MSNIFTMHQRSVVRYEIVAFPADYLIQPRAVPAAGTALMDHPVGIVPDFVSDKNSAKIQERGDQYPALVCNLNK